MWLLEKPAPGRYAFCGRAVPSREASLILSEIEIKKICLTLMEEARKQKGIEFVQVWTDQTNKSGLKLVCTDNLSMDELEELREDGASTEEVQALNYFSILVDDSGKR